MIYDIVIKGKIVSTRNFPSGLHVGSRLPEGVVEKIMRRGNGTLVEAHVRRL